MRRRKNTKRGFRSWAGFARCEAPIWTPEGVDDLQEVIARQAQRGRVRMVGGGYSVTNLVPTDGSLVSTDALKRVLRFEPEGPTPFIEVEAGMTVWELARAVAPFGLRPIMPSLFAHPTLAGLMAVGGHGVGRRVGCFADGVDAIDVVDARGERRRLQRGDPNYEALTTSLGCLGAIYSVRVRLEPDHPVRIRQRRVDRARFLAELDDLAESHEAVEFFLVPRRPDVIVITFDRTDAVCTPPSRWGWQRRVVDELAAVFVEGLGAALGERAPRLLFEVTTGVVNVHYQEKTWVEWASTAYHIETSFPDNRNGCYCFDRREVAVALQRYGELLDARMRRREYPLTMAMHGRITGPSSSWLSPAFGRTTAHLDLATHVRAVGGREFFDEVEEAWLELPSTRAHWGKLHTRPRRFVERYPRFADFEAYRSTVDPDGVFLNDYLTDGLGLGLGGARPANADAPPESLVRVERRSRSEAPTVAADPATVSSG